MSIAFSQVPRTSLVPFAYIEIDSSRSDGGPLPFRSLLVGQKLAAAGAVNNVPVQIASAAQAADIFGDGSILHLMAAAFRRANPLGELWAVPAAPGATAGEETITFGGNPTAAGEVALYVAGRRVSVPVTAANDAAAVATSAIAAINAVAGLPVHAAVGGGNTAVDVTALNAGAAGAIDIRTDYYATDALPAGLTVAVAQKTAPAGEAGVAAAMDGAAATEAYDVIATAYAESASIGALEGELTDRWNASAQLDGVGIAAISGTLAEAQTYGGSRNSDFVTVLDASTTPTPAWEWAAAVAGAVALSAEADPAMPFQTLPIPGVLPAAASARRDHVERETLLGKGISTHVVDAGGVCRIERLITTSDADAWLNLNVPLTLSYLRRSLRARLTTKYARFKLASDGTRFRPGQKILTPSTARAEAIAWYRDMEERGLVEDGDAFKAGLIVERNADNQDRLDFMLPADLVNQMRIFGARIAFKR